MKSFIFLHRTVWGATPSKLLHGVSVKILFAALCWLLAITAASAQTTWTGATDTDWHTAGNWNPSGAPAADDDVVIADVDNDPTIPANTAALAKSVVVNAGGVFAIAATGSLMTDGSTDFEGRRFKDQMQKPSVVRRFFLLFKLFLQ